MPFEIVHPIDRFQALVDWAIGAQGSIIIASPFVSAVAVKQLINFLAAEDVILIVRGQPGDFRAGVCDKAALRLAIGQQWRVFFDYRLHAKVFSDGAGRLLVGSANLTAAGFGIGNMGNFEVLLRGSDEESHYLNALKEFVSQSSAVSLDWIEAQPDPHLENYSACEVLPKSHAGKFSLLDLPQSRSLTELYANLKAGAGHWRHDKRAVHDWALFGFGVAPADSADLFGQFLELPLIKAFLIRVGDGEYFGALRLWLIENVRDVPTPSREDFNTHLNRLYAMVVEAGGDKYERVVPGRHSEMLRKRIALR